MAHTGDVIAATDGAFIYVATYPNEANVVKHARASSATVRIAATNDLVLIEVSDDGRGFDPAALGREHFGLRSMRGRVADLAGSLEVTSVLGRGTILHVEVPARPGE